MRCPKGFVQKPPKSGNCVSKSTKSETKKVSKSKRCPKGTRKNKKTGECEQEKEKETVYFGKIGDRDIEIEMYKNVASFLEKNVMKKSAEKFRKINEENHLEIPLQEYPDDNRMKDYIIEEILELAYYYELEHTKPRQKIIISLKSVKMVIKMNDELSILLK
jgi:hypothetical protein